MMELFGKIDSGLHPLIILQKPRFYMFDWHLNTPLGCFFWSSLIPAVKTCSSWQAERVLSSPKVVSSSLCPPSENVNPPQVPLTQQYMFHPPPFGFFFNFWVLSCWKEGVGVGMFMLKGMLKHKILAAPKRHFNIVLLSFEQKDKYCRSTWNI